MESGRLSSSCHILSWLATSTGRPDRCDGNYDDDDDDDDENDDDEVVEDVAATSTGHPDRFDGNHHEDDIYIMMRCLSVCHEKSSLPPWSFL